MKGNRVVVFVAVALLLLLGTAVLATPALATPPKALNFSTTVVYDLSEGPPSVSGTWIVSGDLFSTSGSAWIDHFNAGINDAGLRLRNSHTTEVYSDAYGTITVEAHITNISGLSPFSGDGHWVIKSGTGRYSNLRGQGRVSVVGTVDWPSLILTVENVYTGVGHFDPSK